MVEDMNDNYGPRDEVQMALTKQQGDKVKSKIKKLLQNVDANGTGTIKMDIFKEILQLHNVNLTSKNWGILKASCQVRTGPNHDQLLHYKEALPMIAMNMEVADPLMRDWILRSRK